MGTLSLHYSSENMNLKVSGNSTEVMYPNTVTAQLNKARANISMVKSLSSRSHAAISSDTLVEVLAGIIR